MIHTLLVLCLTFGTAAASATTVQFQHGQRPAEMVTSIQSALKQSNAWVHYDLTDRVLQVWAPLDLHLPPTPKIQRGRVLRELVNVLRGERAQDAPWSLLLKHPEVTITDADGHAIAWADLTFPVHQMKIGGDPEAAVTAFFSSLPATHLEKDSASPVRLRGALVLDLGDLAPEARREVRGRFEQILSGAREHHSVRYEAGEAAIEFIPDDGGTPVLADEPRPVTARPTLRHALRVTSGPGWTLDQCVVKNVVDLEIWLARNLKANHDVELDLDDAVIDAGRRADFRRMFQEYLDLGFLPRGYQLPPNRVRLVPAPAMAQCQNTLATP